VAADLGIPFRLAEVDGVPCFFADAPGPASAGLLFRVGRADEQLATGGLTELVQRLALSGFGGRRYEYEARADATTASFYATGEPAELAEFVRDVARSLGAFSSDGIDGERRVLGIDAERRDPTTLERMLMMRFGAVGHGLAFYEPFGLRWLRAEHVEDWARRWFTRGNAALWMTCPPPAGLRLDLPDGARMPTADPVALAALALPSFAAAGSDGVASTMLAPRSAAIGAAARTVAGRAHAAFDGEVATWQFPLTAGLTHRLLSAGCGPEAVGDLVAIFDSVAADGPTRDELADATEAAVHAACADDAVPGGLERMAVDELLGAPRRWKEDLAHEAESVSYAEAAAALREALTTQILLTPVGTAKPGERFQDFPWFSHERIEGMPLRTLKRGQGVRIVVSQEGVSHVADETGHASTVRFGDVAAALQEPDGSLTLIGRDGALVPIDPHAYKGAGQVVADLEQRLPPELVVPPRETGRLEQLARRKLRLGAPVAEDLQLLGHRLDHDEQAVTLCEAVLGFKRGVLALTDRRVIWLHRGPREPMVRELPYGDVLNVKLSRIPSLLVTIKSPVGETAFSQIQPKERATEIAEEIRRRASVRG
jgi:hypothetical protein